MDQKDLDLTEMVSNKKIGKKGVGSIAERDLLHQWHPYTQMKDFGFHLPVVSAKGVKIQLEDGSEIIDAISSWWVNLYGHGHPKIAQSLKDQAEKLDHVLFAGFTHEPAVELGERLLALVPKNFNRLFFSDNGSTSVEVAMKMVLQYFWNNGETERREFLAFEDAYHGDTFGAMSTGGLGVFNAAFQDMLPRVNRIPVPTAGKENATLAALQKIDLRKVAGFLFEPFVQGAAGMRFYDGKTLDEVCNKVKLAGGFNIADEVMTGFGRLDSLFASSQLGLSPDVICLSKGLTAGVLPMGLTLTSEVLFQGFWDDEKGKAFMHGHSFTANPLGCAVALAGLDLLESEEIQKSRKKLIEYQSAAVKRFAKHPFAKNVRSKGTLFALELAVNEDASYHSHLKDELYAFFISKGVLLRPLGNVLYVLPPFTIDNESLDVIYNAIEACLNQFQER